MSDTYSYEVLEPGGHARLVGNVLDRISRASANPASAVGSSHALLGDAETASWMERTTAADGAALIESVRGNTVVESGSLLPVRMEGIETVGFNQWDEVWQQGAIDHTTGENIINVSTIRSKNYIPVFPSTTYYAKIPNAFAAPHYYDADKSYIGYETTQNTSGLFTTPANAHYMRFNTNIAYGSTYNNDICINISDPARNGTYEPYWRSELAIPVSTYFPDGMRSAGSVRDELRADAAVTRVGSVKMNEVTWDIATAGVFYLTESQLPNLRANNSGICLSCEAYTPISAVGGAGVMSESAPDMSASVSNTSNVRLYVKDTRYSTQAEFNAATTDALIFYPLATPTTTPIDPPLPMSYRTGAGGTERVMVASGTQSAPPVFATRYPLDPADLAASIAPRESATAEANHAVGDLVMLGWTLCKVTTAIARGETIAIGTNVTRTSVAAELAALS